MSGHEGSCGFMDGDDGVHRIHPDRPGSAHIQQALNYRRITWSFDRISPCYHVHSPRAETTKAGPNHILNCPPAELEILHARPPFRPERKRLTRTSTPTALRVKTRPGAPFVVGDGNQNDYFRLCLRYSFHSEKGLYAGGRHPPVYEFRTN